MLTRHVGKRIEHIVVAPPLSWDEALSRPIRRIDSRIKVSMSQYVTSFMSDDRKQIDPWRERVMVGYELLTVTCRVIVQRDGNRGQLTQS
jgi:hypothetical protein